MSRNTLIFNKYNIDDENFVSQCKNMNSYQNFIGDSISTDNLYIINYKEDIGLLEIYDINNEDSNLSINVFLIDKYIATGGLALFKAIDFVFSKYKVHKLILKVFDYNKRMIDILNRFKVFCEGQIMINKHFVNIYSILEDEYYCMKNSSWRDVCRGL